MTDFSIYGTVRDSMGDAVTGVSVFITNPSGVYPNYEFPQPEGAATNANGDYSIDTEFLLDTIYRDETGYFRDDVPIQFEVRTPDDTVLATSVVTIPWVDTHAGRRVDLTADPPIIDPELPLPDDELPCSDPDCEGYGVSGLVQDAGHRPVQGRHVTLLRQRFLDTEVLGFAVSDLHGHYDIPFFEERPCRSSGPGVAVFVELRNPGGLDPSEVTVRSHLQCPQRNRFVINLNEAKTLDMRSDYQRIEDAIAVHTAGTSYSSLATTDFDEDDVDWLTKRSGLARPEVVRYVESHRARATWAELANLPQGRTIPAPAFYAWINGSSTTELTQIATRLPHELVEQIEQAISEGYIEPVSAGDAAQWAGWLEDELSYPTFVQSTRKLPQILEIGAFPADPEKTDMIDFVRRYQQERQDPRTFWSSYRQHVASQGLTVDVDALILHLRLASLVSQHVPMISRMLAQMSESGSTVTDIEDFASYGPGDWSVLMAGITSDPGQVDPPEHTPGETEADRIANYALALTRSFYAAFPSRAMIHTLVDLRGGGDFAGHAVTDLRDFVIAHPEFDFGSTVIDEFIADISPQPDETLVVALKVLQRLLGVVDGYDVANQVHLLELDGIHCAQQIASAGREQFVARFGEIFGRSSAAEACYRRAHVVDNQVSQLVLMSSPGSMPAVAGLPGVRIEQAPEGGEAPTDSVIADIFGSFDRCACEHCQSMLSAAAYHQDVLSFLRDAGTFEPDGDFKRLKPLVALGIEKIAACAPHIFRRGDIGSVLLNCDNANVVLPYIDIVNERLEECVMRGADIGLFPDNFEQLSAEIKARHQQLQTTWTADQLAAHPEHLSLPAYEILRSVEHRGPTDTDIPYPAIRPWILPFDLFLTEARLYLEQLGTPRKQLYQALLPWARDEIENECLAMSRVVRELVTDPAGPDPINAPIEPRTLAWFSNRGLVETDPETLADLDDVLTFLHATDLSMYQALQLIETWWAGSMEDPALNLKLYYAEGKACSLEGARFAERDDETVGIGRDRLGRFHRLVRMSHHCDLDFDQLDEAVVTLSPSMRELDDEFLEKFVELQALRTRFPAIAFFEQLSWWGDIEARPKNHYVDGERVAKVTLWNSLFLSDPSLDDTLISRFTVTVDSGTGELALGDANMLVDHETKPIVLAALGLESSEYDAVAKHANLPYVASGPDEGKHFLTIAAMSALHLRVSLARALDIPVTQVLRLEAISGILLTTRSGDVVINTHQVPALIEVYDSAKAMGLTVPELDFIVADELPEALSEQLSDTLSHADGFRLTLEIIRATQLICEEIPAELDDIKGEGDDSSKFGGLIEGVFPDAFVEGTTLADLGRVVGLIERATPYETPGPDDETFFDSTVLAGSVFTARGDVEGFDPIAQSLWNDYFGFDNSQTGAERMRKVAREVLHHRRLSAVRAMVIDRLSGALSTSSEQINLLLREIASKPDGSVDRSFVDFLIRSSVVANLSTESIAAYLAIDDDLELLAESGLNGDVTGISSEFPDVYDLLRRAQRAALVFQRLALTGDETTWLFSRTIAANLNANLLQLLDPTKIDHFSVAQVHLGRLQNLHRWLEVGRSTFGHFSAWNRIIEASFSAGVALTGAIASDTDFMDLLVEETGWDPAELEFVLAANRLTETDAVSFDDLRGFDIVRSIAEAFALRAHLDHNFEEIYGWIALDTDHPNDNVFEVSPQQAVAIKSFARSNYDDATWARVIRPLRDKLREKQRDAAKAYAAVYFDHRQGDGYSLSDWQLVDIETSACQMTSRLVASLSSLQTFVQRIGLGLEVLELREQRCFIAPGAEGLYYVELSDEQLQQWDWMKRYRVWEANRRVMLHPENWLEPRLRDDKTELFEAFERAVDGGEIDDGLLENAVTDYLRGLNRLNRLRVSGVYTEELSVQARGDLREPLKRKMYVFGRSKATESKMFYREVDIEGRIDLPKCYRWGPWQQLPFEVESRWVLPVVHNRRLMVIWPEFEFESDPKAPSEDSDRDDQGISSGQVKDQFIRVSLRWAEYLHGEWSAPRKSDHELVALRFEGLDADEELPGRSAPEQVRYWLPRGNYSRVLRPADSADIYLSSAVVGLALRINVHFQNTSNPKGKHAHLADANQSFNIGLFEFGGCDGSVIARPNNCATEEVYQLNVRPRHSDRDGQGFDYDWDDHAKGNEDHTINLAFEPNPTYEEIDHYFDLSKTEAIIHRMTDPEVVYGHHDFRVGCSDGGQGDTSVANGVDLKQETFWATSSAFIQNSSGLFFTDPLYAYRPVEPHDVFPARWVERGPSLHAAMCDDAIQRLYDGEAADADGLWHHRCDAEQAALATIVKPVVVVHNAFHAYACRMLTEVELYGLEGLYNPRPGTALYRQRRERDFFTFEGDEKQRPFLGKGSAQVQFPDGIEPWDQFADSDFVVPVPDPVLDFQFEHGAPYSIYNWEVFYHIPMYVADRLEKSGQYADALKWLGYLLKVGGIDASGDASTAFEWRIKPFVPYNGDSSERPPSIRELLNDLALKKSSEDSGKRQICELPSFLEFSRENPFNPWGIARLRTAPLMLAVFMKQIDVLVAWGDHLFRRETRESVNEATQLYVMAAELLGEEPELLPARSRTDASFRTFEDSAFGGLSNALVEVENHLGSRARNLRMSSALAHPIAESRILDRVDTDDTEIDRSSESVFVAPWQDRRLQKNSEAVSSGALRLRMAPVPEDETARQQGDGRALYFCVPANDKLLGYWGLVEDRLQKIRNCLDIDGRALGFPLFDPPLDPAALVSAVAGGLNVSAALNDLYAPAPNYRFQTHMVLAKELVGDLVGLGGKLRRALERKDAELLEELQADHEIDMLSRLGDVLKIRVEEAEKRAEAVAAAHALSTQRRNYIRDRSRENDAESRQKGLMVATAILDGVAAGVTSLAAILSLIPTNDGGAAGAFSAYAALEFGGSNVGGESAAPYSVDLGGGNTAVISGDPKMANWEQMIPTMTTGTEKANNYGKVAGLLGSLATALEGTVSTLTSTASAAGLRATLARRTEEWDHQTRIAEADVKRAERSMAAAEANLAAVRSELVRHDLEVENSKTRRAYYEDKFTQAELFGWMADELSKVYFSAYELAFDVARRAQRCYELESMEVGHPFITFGHWNSQYQGLLAGQRLADELTRLEQAHMARHRQGREYELTKTISLAQLEPTALLALQETGSCFFDLPELVFDLDHPSHFRRRIKSIQLSVPAVVDRHINVAAKLSLVRSAVRMEALATGVHTDGELIEDTLGATESITTCSSDGASGLFELRGDDPRYLPFEHRGVVSSWKFELTHVDDRFDSGNIADLVVTIRFTAREGGEPYRQLVESQLKRRLMAPRPSEVVTDADPAKFGQDPLPQYENATVATNRPWPDLPALPLEAVSLRTSFRSKWHALTNDGGVTPSIDLGMTAEHLGAGQADVGEVYVFAALIYADDASLPDQAEMTLNGQTVDFQASNADGMGVRVMTGPHAGAGAGIIAPIDIGGAVTNWALTTDQGTLQGLEDIVLLVVHRPKAHCG